VSKKIVCVKKNSGVIHVRL